MNRTYGRFLRAGAILLLAVCMLLAVIPVQAIGENARQAAEARRGQSDMRKSELSPYDENGEIGTRSSHNYTPNDDFSMIRVLITTGSVSTISFRLYGAYCIEQNNTPLDGTTDSPVTVTINRTGSNVSASVNGSTLCTGAQIDICRVDLAESGGWAELRTSGNSDNNGRKYLGNLRLSANSNGSVRFVNVVPTAHYLYGIIPYEMSEGCNIEALKAQAVVAKTYAFGFTYAGSDYEITDSFTYQGYRGYNPGHTKCMQACLDTVGLLLFYNNTVPLAFYGATNGGETTLPSYVFGSSPIDEAYEIRLDDLDIEYGSTKLKKLDITYGDSVSNSAFRSLLESEASAVVGRSVELVSVLSADVNTPKHSGCTRDMTKMDCTVRVNDNGTNRNVSVSFNVSKLKSYGVFSGNYKIYWGKRTGSGYRVYYARWGHGLGLSQYGADGHAAEGESCRQILNFYFRKMQLLTVTERAPEGSGGETNEIIAYGVVNTPNSRMRSGPGLEYSIIAQFGVGTHVDVITEVNGWIFCIAGNKLGYIRGDLVDITIFTAPPGAVQPVGIGNVPSDVHDAVLMDGPSEYCNELLELEPGAECEVWHEIGSWYHVCYEGEFYFLPKSKLTVRITIDLDLHPPVSSIISPGIKPRP